MWLVSKTNLSGKSCFGFNIEILFSDRFVDDKFFVSDQNSFMIQDGITLNKKELLGENDISFSDFLLLLQKKDRIYFSNLKGPFTGCYYNDNDSMLIAFGNQTGDAAIYYYFDDNSFAVSSDFNMVYKWCQKNHKTLTFNQVAANHILSLGFITEGNTIANEIKKQNPGEYIIYQNGKVSVFTYHRFEFGRYQIDNMHDAIVEVDSAFKIAVRRCFDKDIEYGYENHLSDISGGLDSRMTNWVAKKIGYANILNTCYAQNGSRDHEFAEMVAKALGNEFYFEALDSADFLFDIEKLVRMNYGQAVYSGITGGERLLSHIDFSKFGLEHTGQLGDVVVGYKEGVLDLKGNINPAAISYTNLVSPILKDVNNFINDEEFAFYYRFFHGTLSTHYIRRKYTEAVSPFIDIDFLQLCFHISPDLRKNHNLYWKWIKTYYPEAAQIPSTRNQGNFRMNVYHRLPASVGRFIIKACKSLGFTSAISDKRGMNPFDLWYANNVKLRTFIENYFNDHIVDLEKYSVIYQDLNKVFYGELVGDKMLALTVLGIYQVYFKGLHE